jgi:hypothetical protein
MELNYRRQGRMLLKCRRHFHLIVIPMLFLLGLFVPEVHAEKGMAKAFEESQVKAVFLFNLTKFIVWPDGGRRRGDKVDFVIGIIGEDPFEGHLEKVFQNETFKGRHIVIRRYNSQEHLAWPELDLVFIGAEFNRWVPEFRRQARAFGVLTVGDVEGFCLAGGMINLLTIDDRVRIEVNVEETRMSDLAVSAQVLKLARIVATFSGDDL